MVHLGTFQVRAYFLDLGILVLAVLNLNAGNLGLSGNTKFRIGNTKVSVANSRSSLGKNTLGFGNAKQSYYWESQISSPQYRTIG